MVKKTTKIEEIREKEKNFNCQSFFEFAFFKNYKD